MTHLNRFFLAVAVWVTLCSFQQPHPSKSRHMKIDPAHHWADSVFNHLTTNQRIAQLFMIRAYSNSDQDHIDAITQLIKEKGIGGLVFFQGGPVAQAELTNYYQSISKVPLFIGMDGEWGLGMRLDSVISFPKQMELGAMPDSDLVYQMGLAVGQQCKRMGVQINFAPDVDVNNNPDNPVINDRSFGENKYKVADYGIQYMQGLQREGIIAVAKHFPGHGDTNVDSHKALPEIDKSMAELNSLELYPFKKMIHAGVKGIMVAHLYIPAIDRTKNLPTSLSYKNVTLLLKRKLGYKGLVFTDALDMQGVAKYYKNGRAAVKALQAGDDILVLPENVDEAIAKIKWAVAHHYLSMATINLRVKKILMAKYHAGLNNFQPIDTMNLVADLNSQTLGIKKQMDDSAITVLSNENFLLPIDTNVSKKIAYVGVGLDTTQTDFVKDLQQDHPVDAYYFPATSPWENIAKLAKKLKYDYDAVIIGVHNYQRMPENNFGLTESELLLINQLQQETRAITVDFGNPYAIKYFTAGNTIVAAYEDDSTMHQTAADLLFGKIDPIGKLSVSVSPRFPYGSGMTTLQPNQIVLPYVQPEAVGMDTAVLKNIDDIAEEAIDKHAAPGCVVLGMKDGKIFFNKAYGYLSYDKKIPVTLSTMYDMASCTKICATLMAVMQLYDEKKLNINKTLGDYLPWLRGSDKAPLHIKDVLLHQAGLVAWIPFYKATLYDGVHPDSVIYSHVADPLHTVRVAENLYMNPSYIDTMFRLIRDSKLGPLHKYVYSDNDFILMQKIVEAITHEPLDEYVKKHFYDPLGMKSTGFRPRGFASLDRVAPTEDEKYFRLQQIHGDVHDPGAAMFGGVSGHAGLFSDTYDLAVLMQMILNGGSMNGVQYIKPSTIKYFTSYQSDVSRRGLGWDKPEKDRADEKVPYPCKSASPETFGHTGFTGTCIWVDPKYKLVFVFLSNRVNPDGGSNMKLIDLNIRGRIQETMYHAMGVE